MRFSPSWRLGRWGAFFLLLASLGLVGCAPPVGSVSGKVSYKGKLLKGGNVTFVGAEGKGSATTTIKEDGSYNIPKVPTGPVKICVETKSLNPAAKAKVPKYGPPPGQKAPEGFGQGSEDTSKRYTWIPPQYEDPTKTPVTYTVTAGKQEHDIKLD